MKYTFINLAIVIILIVVIFMAFRNYMPIKSDWSNMLQAFAVIGALVVSGFTLVYAKREYDHHKKSEKTTHLCQYLQRYASDNNTKIITNYILETAELDEKQNIVGFDKSKTPSYVPTVREKEMYMHFFEEIQLMIDDNMIDKKIITDLIGYYIGIFHKIKEYHQDITDYEDERYWKYYLKFVRSIPDDFYA